MNKDLTNKQEAFVNEYVLDWNATQAAKRAGYSEKTAYSQGQRLLKNVEIVHVIQARKRALADAVDLKAEDIIFEAIRLKDMCMEVDEKGKPRDATNAARMIQSLGNYLELWGQNKKDKPSEGVQFVIEGLYPKEEEEEQGETTKIKALK